MLAAILTLCGLTTTLTSCSDSKDEVQDKLISDDGGNANTGYKTIFLMSDIHVMSPQLLEREGSAYSSYLNFDPKLLEYSADVLESLVDEAIKRKPDLIIIPGDLTKDGELVSHQLVASILTRLRTAGIPVILVPGNHDIDNPEGYYFNGDEKRSAERTSPEQFKQIYADFGYNQAYATDPASLSFVCEPLEGLVLLCLDTNLYEENLYKDRGDEKDYNQTAGRIRPATLTWALDEADKARALGKQVVLVEHHNIVQHHDAQGHGRHHQQQDHHIHQFQKGIKGIHDGLLGLHVQELCPVGTLVGAVVEFEIGVLAGGHGVEDDVGLALIGFTLVVEDVLVVGIAAGVELRVVPLRTHRKGQRAVGFIIGVGGSVEATVAALTDGSEQRAVVGLDDLRLVATYEDGIFAEVPCSTLVGGVEDVVV